MKKQTYAARLAGEALVVTHDAPFPEVCIKCGTHEQIRRRDVVFTWTPVWVRFLVLCGIGLVLRLLTTVRASLVIPLCARCDARWSSARTATIAGAVGLACAFVVMRALDASRLGLGVLLAAVIGFVVLRLTYVRSRTLQVQRIDEEELTFEGVHAQAAREIVDGSR